MITPHRLNAVELSSRETEDAYSWKHAVDNGVVTTATFHETIDRLKPAQPRIRKRPRSFGAMASDAVRRWNFDAWLAANWERD